MRPTRIRRARRRAFTLIEVLLVVLIVLGLGTLATVALMGTRQGANKDIAIAQMEQIKRALSNYEMALSEYPDPDAQGLEALVTRPDFEEESMGDKWRGPYLEKEKLTDPWGSEIRYELIEEETGESIRKVVRLTSSGPDKEEGTEDDIVVPKPDEDEL